MTGTGSTLVRKIRSIPAIPPSLPNSNIVFRCSSSSRYSASGISGGADSSVPFSSTKLESRFLECDPPRRPLGISKASPFMGFRRSNRGNPESTEFLNSLVSAQRTFPGSRPRRGQRCVLPVSEFLMALAAMSSRYSKLYGAKDFFGRLPTSRCTSGGSRSCPRALAGIGHT